MFKRDKRLSDRLIEDEKVKALRLLQAYPVNTEEYVAALNAVRMLHRMQETPSFVSKDTLASVGANLLGILMILNHETYHPIVSKALSFVTRTRV